MVWGLDMRFWAENGNRKIKAVDLGPHLACLLSMIGRLKLFERVQFPARCAMHILVRLFVVSVLAVAVLGRQCFAWKPLEGGRYNPAELQHWLLANHFDWKVSALASDSIKTTEGPRSIVVNVTLTQWPN